MEEATRWIEIAASKFEALKGPTHWQTLSTRNRLGDVLYESGQMSQAEACYRGVVDEREKVLGAEHPSTLASKRNLAKTMLARGGAREAEPLCRQAEAGHRKILGDAHNQTILSQRLLEQVADAIAAENAARDGSTA